MAPEDWYSIRLDETSTVIDCKHRTPKYVNNGVPLVSPGTIKWGPLDLISPTKRVEQDEYESLMDHCTVDVGDLVLSRNQSVGVASFVDSHGPFVLGQDTVLIKPTTSDSSFLFYNLQSVETQRTIFKLAGGSTFSRINLGDIRKLKLIFPPLPEQQKIARILSTWDKAITNTEKRIDNSKQQKKALMQQLLTGKKRFPGFKGEWEDKYLHDVAQIIVSPVDKKTVEGEIPVQICNYTDVYYNSRITKTLNFMSATAKQSEIDKYTLEVNDVIVTKDSETPGDIAVPALVSEDLEGVVCGYHLAIIRPNENLVEGAFLNYLFSIPKTRYYFFTLATGATRFGLSVGGINKAHFTLPPLEEQQKIATALTNADREIELLEQQLADLKQEKKALMQQLLTGKRRVTVDNKERVA
ncbi:hypothetical protein A3735_07585 [Oleiphilus sp. HI0061]|uniref:restriction endonuclease subunit S n=1 Tax=Oleiphilus sp. HI0061 TaxID=1822239 RepID=UPI0007D03FEC|nr:restriction endonuclease subunit S [Oleiphilus sp. HI0061]KZY65926.1 hypothetical protein A3735_07585 [Oleiphilus sp. HI0061]